jgi:two-component system, cell cycle response regulator
VAERLCQVVGEEPVLLSGEIPVQVTVSIGLAISAAGEMPHQFDTVSEIVDRADRALLVAKSAGRNQVTISRTAA